MPETLPVLVPGQEWRTFWDTTFDRRESDLPRRHEATVKFKDSRGKEHDFKSILDWGLVNRVVADDALDDEVDALVDVIARSSPLTVGIGKEAFYSQIELDEHRAYDLTKAVMAMNARADDAQEGMCAFLQKRAPTWRGT